MKQNLPEKNWMIDIETDGLNPNVNSITSIAVVEFNIEDIFDRPGQFLHLAVEQAKYRSPDQNTLNWRKQHDVSAREGKLKRVPVDELFIHLYDLLRPQYYRNIVWAKPTIFDISFLQAYYAAYALDRRIPWHYRDVRDLRSFVEGASDDWDAVAEEAKMYVQDYHRLDTSQAHDAYYDCIYQIAHLKMLEF